jgi:hypothetical protein
MDNFPEVFGTEFPLRTIRDIQFGLFCYEASSLACFVMKCYLFGLSICFVFIVYVVLSVGLLFIKFQTLVWFTM